VKWEGRLRVTGETRNVYTILVCRINENGQLESPGGKWEFIIETNINIHRIEKCVDYIKMDQRNVLKDWINLAQDRDQWRAVVSTIMNLWASQNVGKFLSSCTTAGLQAKL
jgi:hypothetical protein